MDINNGDNNNTNTSNAIVKKKTMGRRKIEIKKILKKPSLQVTFSKRRKGLFRKASEMAILCGAEIAVIVQSPADKIFAFGDPSVEALIGRFQGGGGGTSSISSCWQIVEQVEGMRRYEEAVRKLEVEKKVKRDQEENVMWWERAFEGMDLQELEEYAAALERLRDSVWDRVQVLGSV